MPGCQRAFLIAGAWSMFFGWTRNSTFSRKVIVIAASLLLFICSNTRCSAVSPSASSASRFAPERDTKNTTVNELMYFISHQTTYSFSRTILSRHCFIPVVLVQAVCWFTSVSINLKNLYPLTDRPTVFLVLTCCYVSIFLSSVCLLYY